MTRLRHRWRTRLRPHLPYALLWLLPKGRNDCGGHEWYNSDGAVEHCYHCEVGPRPRTAATGG